MTNLATWWDTATGGVNYVRAQMPARHLPGQVLHLDPWLDLARDENDEIHMPRQEGAAIWMIAGNATRGILMRSQQTWGTTVLMELDDNYQVGPPVNFGAWKSKIDGTDDHSYEAHMRIVPWVDGLIVSTPAIEKAYRDANDRIFVCQNCVDPDDWDTDPPHQKDGVLRVGFAGSDSHWNDFRIIEPALRWAANQPNVEVVIAGILVDLAPGWRRIEWTDDLAEYRRNVADIDIMLCPLIEGEWSNCKSDLKAMEAAMAGAVPVVARAEPFRPWFQGRPAWVVDNPVNGYGWKKALRYLLANRDEVRDMARLAREYVVKERSIQGNVWRWREAIEECSRDRMAVA